MSTMGTFDAFTSARLGIYAAQHGFRVTGNNISNINTVGYTRQRLDQVSFKAGAYDRYRSQMDNHVGSGALVMNINQVRDPTLDVRYRDTNASFGFNNEMLDGLEKIASILDEVGVGDDTNVNKKGDGRLHAQIQAVSEALRAYSKDPTKDNNNLVRNAASSLCEILNSYARELEQLRVETEQKFKDQVTEINECLTNIRDLNEEIRDNEIFGDNALELRDERNRQIDKLSEYLHIKVVYSEEDVGAGRKVEKLSIYLDNSNPDDTVHTDEAMLIDGIFGAQLSSPDELPMANAKFNPDSTSEFDVGSYRYIHKDTQFEPGHEGDLKHVLDGPYYTNDPELAYMLDNKGKNLYGLQISELRDQRDRLWEGITTEFKERTDGVVGKQAIYQTKITKSENWADGNTFTLTDPNGTVKTYTVGTDIPVNQMNNPGALASFLAKELGTMYQNDYTVSASGDGTIRFVAKNAGAVGGNGPAKAPEITLGPGNPNAEINPAQPQEVQKGVDEQKPNTPPETPVPAPLNPNGTETIISYRINDGKWYQVTTVKQHTYPLTLDDNDPYGSLQATRELLTEAGEFTTEYTVNNIDENGTKKRGIPYYQKALDLFAYQFAEEYNKLNQGTYTDDNGVEHSKFVDENGVEIPLDKIKDGKYEITKDVPTMKQAADGSISIVNPDTGEYEKKDGWTLANVGGTQYCVDENGYLVGAHGNPIGQGCNINQKFKTPIADNLADIRDALNVLGYDITSIPDPPTEDAVTAVLQKCLQDDEHGLTPSTTTPVTKEVKLPKAGVLFSNRNDGDDTTGINASNITISHSWSNGDVQLVPKFEILWGGDLEHSTQNTNADHMVTMLDKDHAILFNPKSIVPDAVSEKLFEGSFGEMFNDMCTTLGEDRKATNVALNMYYTQVVEIDTARDGVSGVDLNDEAMNLMQYQKAYSAACRLMTVVDEALDRLINNTGIAGR